MYTSGNNKSVQVNANSAPRGRGSRQNNARPLEVNITVNGRGGSNARGRGNGGRGRGRGNNNAERVVIDPRSYSANLDYDPPKKGDDGLFVGQYKCYLYFDYSAVSGEYLPCVTASGDGHTTAELLDVKDLVMFTGKLVPMSEKFRRIANKSYLVLPNRVWSYLGRNGCSVDDWDIVHFMYGILKEMERIRKVYAEKNFECRGLGWEICLHDCIDHCRHEKECLAIHLTSILDRQRSEESISDKRIKEVITGVVGTAYDKMLFMRRHYRRETLRKLECVVTNDRGEITNSGIVDRCEAFLLDQRGGLDGLAVEYSGGLYTPPFLCD